MKNEVSTVRILENTNWWKNSILRKAIKSQAMFYVVMPIVFSSVLDTEDYNIKWENYSLLDSLRDSLMETIAFESFMIDKGENMIFSPA